MTLHIQLVSQVQAQSLAPSHLPASLLLLTESNGQQQPTFAVPSESTPPHQQRAYTSQSRLLVHHLSSVLKPRPSRVQMTRKHGFVPVCVAPRRIVDNGLVDALVVVPHEYCGQPLDISSMSKAKRVDVGRNYTKRDSLSAIFSSSTSTSSKVVLQASRCRESQSLMY